MARYKKIYRDEQHEQDKRRNRIRKTVDVCVAVFWVASVAAMGLYQHNDTVVGTGLIVMGVVNGGYAAFAFWMLKHWRNLTVYDADELYRDKYLFGRKDIEKREQEIAAVRTIVAGIIAITAAICPVVGIGRLLGIC